MARILIVDDELTEDHFYHTLFKKTFEGHEVFIETSAKNAKSEFETYQPDIILLDQMMPDISGLTFAEWVVSNFPFIPIIFATGQSSQANQCMAYSNFYAMGYFKKPFEVPVLKIVIERTLYYNACHRPRRDKLLMVGGTCQKELELPGYEFDLVESHDDLARVSPNDYGVIIVDSTLNKEEQVYKSIQEKSEGVYLLSLQPHKNSRQRLRPMDKAVASLQFGAHDIIRAPVNNEVLSLKLKALNLLMTG